jgi:hypothetical protein
MMPARMTALLMESVPTDWTPWLLAGVGMAALVLLIVVMRPAARRAEPEEEPFTDDAKKPSLAKQRAVERDMSQLMTELSEMARQVSAQLDARSAKLERLMREADERITKLQAMHATSTAASPLPRADATSARRLDALEPVAVGATQSPAELHVNPQYAEVYALADAGEGAADIAARLGRPTGEVELILALRAKD